MTMPLAASMVGHACSRVRTVGIYVLQLCEMTEN